MATGEEVLGDESVLSSVYSVGRTFVRSGNTGGNSKPMASFTSGLFLRAISTIAWLRHRSSASLCKHTLVSRLVVLVSEIFISVQLRLEFCASRVPEVMLLKLFAEFDSVSVAFCRAVKSFARW